MALNDYDREFMELAVNEMCESRAEHEDKVDPKVGAVIVSSNNEVLGQTHRASLREGDHAEYTLIERCLGDKDLEGSTLYVTLEPCTIRGTQKTPCVERIVSARLGRVVIGMPDPNPDIEGRGISFLRNNSIEVDFFDNDLVETIRNENAGFIKYYSEFTPETGISYAEFEGPSNIEKQQVQSARLNDLSERVISLYLNMRGKKFEYDSEELWSFFYKNGFLTKPDNNTYIPTVAGILLFGETPEDFFVQSKVMVEVRDQNRIISEEIGGPLLSLPDSIVEFFKPHIRLVTRIKELKREKVFEYPIEALREAVINAIVHRDYKEGSRIQIQLLHDELVISSPGLAPQPISLEQIRSFDAPAYSRNPRIAATFNIMQYMEERGWGLARMRDALISNELDPPQFDYESGYFTVTFKGQKERTIADVISPDIVREISEKQLRMLTLIHDRKGATRKECANFLGIKDRAAGYHLTKLQALQLIEKRGKGSNTYYITKE